MKTRFNFLLPFLMLLFISVAETTAQEATPWKLDKAHTSVNFSIKHFFSDVTGNFNDFKGTFHFDPDNLAGSNFDFTIKVGSVDTDNGKRDKHLQSKDFFNAKAYPEMRFTSDRIENKGGSDYVAHGDLTIRDQTRKVAIPFKVTGQMEHPMMKGTLILGLEFDTTINRTDFGVGTGDWAATMVVGDEVKIRIPLELNRKS